MGIKNGFLYLVSFLLLILFTSISFSSASIKVSTTDALNIYNFSIEDVKISTVELEGNEYLRARLVGVENYGGVLYEKGAPEIPTISFFVFADNKKNVRVTFPKAKPVLRPLGIRELMPNQESRPKIKGMKVPFIKNFNFYNTDQYWPWKSYEVTEAGSIRGQKRFLVTVYPVKYNPVVSEFRINKNFSVEVINPYKKNTKSSKDINKKELFVFIIGNQFQNSPSLEMYKKFKEDLGYAVETIVVGGAITSPDHIRSRLKEFYTSTLYDLKYAMIVGDSGDVPSERAHNCAGVTDHYYRAIDTNDYDSDINGPDIGVGRITVSNEADLEIVINKFLKYQKGHFNDESWLRSISFIATDDRWQVAEGSHNRAIENYTKPLGYLGDFPQANMPGGDQLYAITHQVSDSTVVDVMKRGRFIINYSGHGSTTYWAGPNVRQRDVRSFNHPDALPFVISNACITGQFTVGESFGETWIKHPHGAIMFWGSMDSSYWDEDDYLEKFMYKKIFDMGHLRFSQITQYSLSELWRQYNGQNKSKYYWETYVTFGDPSIRLRTDRSRHLSIQGPEVLPVGVDSVSYEVLDKLGNPVENVRVALAPESMGPTSVGYTDSEGKVTLKVPFVDPGIKMNVTVYGDNVKQDTKELLIISPESPFYQITNFTVNGRESIDVSVFEELAINFDVRNVSHYPSTGGRVFVEKIEGPLDLVQGEVTIGALGSDEIYSSSNDGNGMRFRVGDAQSNDAITIHFKWITNEGEERNFIRKLIIVRAALEVSAIDFGNPDIPYDGSFGPSDSGSIYLTVTNTGTEILKNAQLEASAGTCLDNAFGQIDIANLAPDETIRVRTPIDVTLSSTCQVNDFANVGITGVYESRSGNLSIEGEGSFLVGRFGITDLVQDDLNVPIPDQGMYQHKFSLSQVKNIKHIKIRTVVQHSYIGDISIMLIHPSGARVLIRNRTGGSTDDFDETYTNESVSDLNSLNGLTAEGEWILEIRDSVKQDSGSLKYFEVVIQGFI